MPDAIFEHLTQVHGARPWGEVLDAGTGRHSFAWLASLPTERVTAVTADPAMARALRAEHGARLRPADAVVVGDWRDEALLGDQRFDVVLADYLLGALDGFAPYYQDRLFARLARHVRGALFVVGLEPLGSGAAALLREMAGVRDACLLLAGERCYREYPADWVARHLASSGFELAGPVARFPIVYRADHVERQMAMSEHRAARFADRRLGAAMREHIGSLRARATAHCETHGGLEGAQDYAIVATPRR